MVFNLFLTTLFVAYGFVALVFARKHPVKREFAAICLFTLLTFFVAIDPNQKSRLMFILTLLTGVSIYLILKRHDLEPPACAHTSVGAGMRNA